MVPETLDKLILGKRIIRRMLFSVCLLIGVAGVAQANTFTVTKTADTNDGVCDADCSLREAINAANNNPGQDTIAFSIGSGAKTIMPLSSLTISESAIIDGTTQPGFAGMPIIELSGVNAGANVTGLRLNGDSITVRGLVINRYSTSYGIEVGGTGHHKIVGNFVGLDLTGTVKQGNFTGISIFSADNIVGGTTAADRNVVSGNDFNSGVAIGGQSATGNLIQGNYIGTDVTGTIAIGNGVGVYVIQACSNNTIGGPTPGARNLISGNTSSGITIATFGNKVQGNYIGTNADGTGDLGNTYGVDIVDGHHNAIGGTNAGEGNVIAFNAVYGVRVAKGPNHNAILSNSIFSNSGMGIDLGGDGVTANDQLDVDTGAQTANDNQNYPVISSALPNGSNTDISGSLNSLANTQFRLEFFSSAAADPTGFGEGKTYLGSLNVTTNGNGDVSNFTFTVPTASIAGQFISATATDPNNNTSEFSQAKQVILPPAVQFNQASMNVPESLTGLTITVIRNGDTGAAATVDYKTNDGSANQRSDYEYAAGTLKFAGGETSKTIVLLINEDMFSEGTEALTMALSNPSNMTLGAQSTVTININDDSPESSTNPIDDAQAFVYMQYHDLLNREPDAAGLQFWINQITSCGADQACIEASRVNVSAAFFLSIEFQETGFLVERIYRASYGNMPGTPVPLTLNEFVIDSRVVSDGVIVTQAGWEQKLESNKQAFTNDFVQRTRFTNAYPTSLTPVQFVDGLFTKAGVTPAAAERQAAINEFGGALTSANTAARARAIRRIAENPALTQQELNRAFVLMQYFGYLRRNPNDAPELGLNFDGYNFWLNKLNQFNGNYLDAEMVKAFITSIEYRQRFGQ